MNQPRNYLAMAAAHQLQAELWFDLNDYEQSETARTMLEQYLAASDAYCRTIGYTGYARLLYVRRRAADYYEMHYQQRHHTWAESIRFRSRLEQALLDTMGYDAVDQVDMHLWHDVRLRGAIYQANNRN